MTALTPGSWPRNEPDLTGLKEAVWFTVQTGKARKSPSGIYQITNEPHL